MKPLKLYIEGLQSYIQPQNIDFELLSGSGLFGIFGNTGSGKSTILDAILIALYGKGSRNKDYINKTVDKARVAFEFMMCGQSYKAERAFRRKQEGIECSSARLYRRSPQGWVCLAENHRRVNEEIEKLIGLGLEDFKKCVILPQGEFASFLRAEKGKRNEIIGNLFDLEQYGDPLARKIKERKDKADGEKKAIESAIEAIGDFEYSLIEQTEKEINEWQREAELLGEAAKDAEKAHRELEEKLRQNEQFLEAKESFEKLSAKKDETEGQRALLERYRRAEKLKPYISEHDRLKVRLDELEKKIAAAREKEAELEEKAEKARVLMELAKNERAEKSSAIEGQIPKLEACKVIVENIGQESRRLEDKRKLFGQRRDELKSFTAQLEGIEKDLEKLKEQKEILEAKLDIASQLKKSRAEGGLEEVEKAIGYAAPRFEGMLPYLDGRKKLLKEVLNTYSQGASEDFVKDFGELKKIEQEISGLEGKKAALCSKSEAIKAELEEIEREGRQIRERIEGLKAQLEESGAGRECSAQLLETRIGELRAHHKALEERKNGAEEKYHKLRLLHETQKTELSGLSGNIADVLGELERKREEIRGLLEECGFNDEGEARQVLSLGLDAGMMEKTIKEFEQRLILAQEKYSKFKDKYDPLITNEMVKASGGKLEELREAHRQKHAELAVKRDRLESLKRNWAKLSQLKIELENAQKLCGYLETLQKLVRGKSFMEFVAEEYVQDITAAASRHTSHLTGGRYRLCYQGGDFLVEDNYSGGELRAVETLSGGETFLVSLSLALALTETIVRMSDKPIEFFFLDEGFGTLDRELCDTVMNILEKLKRSNFTIGIISHVPELMQRMASRLIVEAPDGERGSEVKHVY